MLNLYSGEPHHHHQPLPTRCSCCCPVQCCLQRCPQHLSQCPYQQDQNDLRVKPARLNPTHPSPSNLDLNVLKNTVSSPWNLLAARNASRGNVCEKSGYGKSLPRGRNFIPYQYIEEDVAIAQELLQRLGVSQAVLFGWCDGAHMSVLFSLRHPHMVHKLIIWGTKASLTRDNVLVFERMRRLSSWSATARTEALKAYDNDVSYITGTFNQYVDAIDIMYKTCGGEIYRNLLPYVQVPVLLLHSIDDMMVARHQVLDLKQQLADCSYYQFSSGGHSYHIKHCQEFNQVCLNFILKHLE